MKLDEDMPSGRVKGKLTTCPDEIDKVAMRKLQQVYRGNKPDLRQAVTHFVDKYDERIYKAPQYQIEPITAEEVEAEMTRAKNTAAGMDGWQMQELAMLPTGSYKCIADIYNLIEGGAQWPASTKHARTAYPSKDPTRVEDPMAYRLFMIMHHLYRRWASIRLKKLQPWVRQWDIPELYAGVPESSRGCLVRGPGRNRGEPWRGWDFAEVRPTSQNVSTR